MQAAGSGLPLTFFIMRHQAKMGNYFFFSNHGNICGGRSPGKAGELVKRISVLAFEIGSTTEQFSHRINWYAHDQSCNKQHSWPILPCCTVSIFFFHFAIIPRASERIVHPILIFHINHPDSPIYHEKLFWTRHRTIAAA